MKNESYFAGRERLIRKIPRRLVSGLSAGDLSSGRRRKDCRFPIADCRMECRNEEEGKHRASNIELRMGKKC